MDEREDLKSIIPFLPLILRSSNLFWPSRVVEALKALSGGPDQINVNSGQLLSVAISDLSGNRLSPSALHGYALFFDDLISRAEAANWFEQVLPAMAHLLLKLPSLLESHYLASYLPDVATGLRMLPSQQPGIVFLSQVRQLFLFLHAFEFLLSGIEFDNIGNRLGCFSGIDCCASCLFFLLSLPCR